MYMTITALERPSKSINYWLLLVTVVLIGLTTYEIRYAPFFGAYYWSTFFVFLGVISSLGLYYHYILKHLRLAFYAGPGILCAITVAYLCYHGVNRYCYPTLLFAFWCIGGVHFVIAICFEADKRADLVNALCLYLSFPVFIILSQYLLVSNNAHHPLVYDELLLAIEGSLGFYPSLLIARFIRSLPAGIVYAANIIYLSLPITALYVYIKLEQIQHKIPISFVLELFLIGIVGYSLYQIIPACGSQYAFIATWPLELPLNFMQKEPHTVFCPMYYPRNCIPSLHTAWTITLLRYAYLLGAYSKAFIWGVAVATLIAVFGIGAHYLVDIVVGLAFANCIGGLASVQLPLNNRARFCSFVFGGLLCVMWYVLILKELTFFQSSKTIAWSVFSLSVFSSIILERNLIQSYKSNRDSFN